MARPDLVANTSKYYPVDNSSTETFSSEESTENLSTPRMKQDKSPLSTSTSSVYPHYTRNINDNLKKDIQKNSQIKKGDI